MPDTNQDIDYQALVDQVNAAAGKPLEATPAAFAAYYGPMAQKISDQTGIDANTILGQFGLETGWGKSIVPGTNNLGNIKDFSKSGNGVSAVDNQTGTTDKYRKYASLDDFANDYANLINSRYKSALNTGTDAAATAKALAMGGYATDPHYASKVVNATATIAKARGLRPDDSTSGSGSAMNPISSANAAGSVPRNSDGSVNYQALVDSLKNHPGNDSSGIGSTIADFADGAAVGAGTTGLGAVALAGRGVKAAGDALGSDGLSSVGSFLNDHATTAVKNLEQHQQNYTGGSTAGKVGNFVGEAAATLPLALVTGPLGATVEGAAILGRAAPFVAGAIDAGTQGAILGASQAAGRGQSDLVTPAVIGGAGGAVIGGTVGYGASKLSQYLNGAGKDFNAAVDATLGKSAGNAATDANAAAGAATGASEDVGGLASRMMGVGRDTVDDAKTKINTIGMTPEEKALMVARESLGPDFESLLKQSQYTLPDNFVGPAVPDALVPVANKIPLTAAQQVDSPRMALLAKNIGNYSPEAKASMADFAMAQQQGIHSAVDAITPEQATINALKKERADAVSKLYAQNDSTLVPVEQFGQDLLDRPAIKTALKNAALVMKNAGDDVAPIMRQTPEEAMLAVKNAGGSAADQLKALQDAAAQAESTAPTHISGRHYQIAEQDLRDQASNMTTATPAERSAAKAALKDFQAAGEQHFPLWSEAQDTYARLSKPVTDAEFMQNFSQHPATTMMNGDTKNVTATNFNSAYKGAMNQGSAKTYGITDEAQQQLNALQSKVNAIARTNQKASAAGSDTAQNFAGMQSIENILGKNTAGGGLSPADLLMSSGTVKGTVVGLAKKAFEKAQQPIRDAAVRSVQEVVQNPAGLAQLVETVAKQGGKLSKEASSLLNDTAQASPGTVASMVQGASLQGKTTILNELTASSKKKVLPFLTTVAQQTSLTGLLQSIQGDNKNKK
ncbi:glucosaminidase domain-containing protein [Caballeronia sp. AZ1_KS37]|uniref:glucosaminidase domain-containing protein n=1 Tax=Caballeronia sp. AZ1_KS37 TaxID=2921756 RepID=UPI002027A2D1|nr:glucosaminidase domain-containing protein [Caballeronia sp. AZ1_KS37]